MASSAEALSLDEDHLDDIIYFARVGDLEEIHELVQQLSHAHSRPIGDVIAATIDPGSGNTPLHMAAANGHEDLPGIVKFLLANLSSCTPATTGVSPSIRPPSSTTAITSPKGTSTPPVNSELAVEASTSPAAPDANNAPTVLASPRAAASSASSFIDHGNASGNTALHWAALNGHVGIVRALADAGADLTRENAAKHDALDEAERAGKLDVVRLLLARLGGKEEADVVMTGDGDEGEGDDDLPEEGAAGEDGGVKITQKHLERLGLDDGVAGPGTSNG